MLSPAPHPLRRPVRGVRVTGGFWRPRLELVRDRMLPHIDAQLERVGVVDAFRVAAGLPATAEPALAADSDLYKWIEAASYVLGWDSSAALRARVDELVALVAAAQQPDGYLNTFYTVAEPGGRWTNLRDAHELYCAGHLFEAAVAHHAATSSEALLDVARRFADHIDERFGAEPGKQRGYCGHPEVELALIRLADETGEERYLALAEYFVLERGRAPYYFDLEAGTRSSTGFGEVFAVNTGDEERRYNQTHAPVVDHDRVVGHAVRATYLYAAATEIAARRDNGELRDAVRRLFRDLVDRHLYITGGLGSSRANEGFTEPYGLPNETAYAETCASIGLVLWSQRMAAADGSAEPLAVAERALYNTILGGASSDGTRFFYENHLADDGGYERQPWHAVACCPPNVARLLASLGDYVYLRGEDELTVALFVDSAASVDFGSAHVDVVQTTGYPEHGNVRLELTANCPVAFTLRIRVPEGAALELIRVDGESVDACVEDGFVVVRRTWAGTVPVELALRLSPRRMHAHPDVQANVGRVAFERPPFVLCVEAPPGTDPSTLGARGVQEEPGRMVPFFERGNRGPAAYAVWLLDDAV